MGIPQHTQLGSHEDMGELSREQLSGKADTELRHMLSPGRWDSGITGPPGRGRRKLRCSRGKRKLLTSSFGKRHDLNLP